MRKEQKTTALDAIQQDPTLAALVNPKWRLQKLMGDIGGWEETEIQEALDKDNFYSKDMMAKADIAIEMLLKGKEPDMVWDATSSFAQKIIDFAKAHRNNLKQDKVKMFTDYVKKHVQVITENMARMATQQKQQPQGQPGQPQGAPQGQPAPQGQMAPRPGTIQAKPAMAVHP